MRAAALVLAMIAGPAQAEGPAPVLSAELILATDRYDHGVLGDAIEWGGLRLLLQGAIASGVQIITLPPDRVFEDVTARVTDLDGDGVAEVLVVETDMSLGASLAVYDGAGKRAATPFIGQRHRWLAPAAVGDFDGDGRPEIAYVDRPHLARELVFVRLEGDVLVELARAPGFSNHRIGDKAITSAVRDCGGVAEVILPDVGWRRVMAARVDGGAVVVRDVGPYRRPGDIDRAARC